MNNTFLSNPLITGEIKEKIFKINDVARKKPRGKFVDLNAYVREEKNKFLPYEVRKRKESESQRKLKEKNKDEIN